MQNGRHGGTAANASSNGQAQQNKQAGKRPIHTVRFGALKAAVWLNETSVGPIHNVTVSRSYKDGDSWKDSGSFGHGPPARDSDTLVSTPALNHCGSAERRDFPRRPTSAGAKNHRIERTDYSRPSGPVDYSCEPPSSWASHSHGNPALRA